MGILKIMSKRGDDPMTWGRDLVVADPTTDLDTAQADAVAAVTKFFHEQYVQNKMYRFVDTTDKANPVYLETLTAEDLVEAPPDVDGVTEIREITAFPRFVGG